MNDEAKNYVTKLCQESLRIPSYTGKEKAFADWIKKQFSEIGFDKIDTDEYGNVLATLKGNAPGGGILFDAHIDTVAVPNPSLWHHDPFGGEIENGRIYGRGASDMKGSLCAIMAAAKQFKEATKGNFSGTLTIAGVVCEECFEGVAARSISKKVKPDIVVIGEASELNLKIGQRGRGEIIVETFGKSAHSANPEKGFNAVLSMSRLILEISKLKTPVHPVLGKGIMELTDIISSPYPGASVVPDYCKVTYDRRLLTGETPEDVLQPIREIIAKMSAEIPGFKAKVSLSYGESECYTGSTIKAERFFPAWLYGTGDQFVSDALDALKEAGLSPEVKQYSFCTNGSHYAGEAHLKTIGFGPSREDLAHTVDEYIEVGQLNSASKGYLSLMHKFLG